VHRSPVLPEKLEELDGLAQPAAHHARTVNHFRDNGRYFGARKNGRKGVSVPSACIAGR
jgi:hypothetical protein